MVIEKMIVRNFRRDVAASLLLASLALIAAGCGTNQASPAPGTNRGLTAQNVTPRAVASPGIRNPKAVAAHLEQLAKGVKGVRGANCVVFGKYAIVGIDVEKTLPRSRVGTIKYAVAEAFRKDPYGIDALVTADMDLDERLREIRQDVANGRPVAGFAEELADIVGRLVPQMPRSVVPPASPDGTMAGKATGKTGVRQMQTNRTTPLPDGSRPNTYKTESNSGVNPGRTNAGSGTIHSQSVGKRPPVGSGNHNVYEMEWNRGQIIDHSRTSGK